MRTRGGSYNVAIEAQNQNWVECIHSFDRNDHTTSAMTHDDERANQNHFELSSFLHVSICSSVVLVLVLSILPLAIHHAAHRHILYFIS